MKRFLSYLLLAVLTLSALTFPSISIAADESVLTTEKATYETEEDIFVTAFGSGKDWVGIYPKGEIPGGGTDSIYWYYVAEDGHTSGSAVEIKSSYYNSTRSEYQSLPAGEYTIYLCANDGYTVVTSVDITLSEDNSLLAPLSATYTKSSDIPYLADGTMAIQLDTSSTVQPTDIVMYFADDNGIMTDYSHLQMQPIKAGQSEIEFELVKNTIVPKGAKYIYVYTSADDTLSKKYAKVTLDANASNYDFGEPKIEFQVVSDTHVTTDNNHLHNRHFTAMLSDIANNSPNSVGLFINGDISDSGNPKEYENVNSLHSSVVGAPQMYWAIGNHDLGETSTLGMTYDQLREQFISLTGEEKTYYDKWIGETHFIFLASEAQGLTAQISEEQFAWFEETIAKDHKEGRPIFVFLHQGLYDVVAGGLQGQKWDGVGIIGTRNDTATRLKKILKKYPEAILFSGHSHWELNSVQTMYKADEKMCYAFNTASAGYLWTSYGDTHSEGGYYNADHGGSQGYYIEIYEDKVLVLGRDFEEGKWMPSAMFYIELTASGEEDTTTENTTEEPTEAPTEELTEELTEANEDLTTVDTMTEESTTASNATASKGCKAAATALLPALLGIGITIFKKRH